MQLLKNYQLDILKSRTTPLLIELSKTDLNKFGENGINLSFFTAQKLYDIPLENEDETNIIFIDGDKAKSSDEIFIFEELLSLLEPQIDEIKNLVIVKKAVTKAISMAIGGVVSGIVGEALESGLEVVLDSIHGTIYDILIDNAVEYLDIPNKIIDEIEGRAQETLNDSFLELFDALKEDKLYLTHDAKKTIEEISHKFKEKLSPAESFRLILQLILSTSIGMQKIIFVKNPHKLDKNSLAILSLLYSFSKDLKDKGKHTGVSVIYAYDDEEFQPYKEVKEEYKESKILLDEQRLYTQRYAMLERPTSDIPRIAVKSHMFVGREEELKHLDERYFYSKEHSKIATIETVSGEPGIGKTKLVKKHLHNIRRKEEYGSKMIQLSLLNQVGHTSSNTGLSSLIDSIVKESSRLENARTFTEVMLDKAKEYATDSVTGWIKGALGVNGLIDVAKAVDDKVFLEARIEKTLENSRGDQDNKSSEQKQQQFTTLSLAIRKLQDELSDNSMPIVLFIDDLQWIDEDSAEYIVEHFIKRFNVHIVATIRPSDATTMLSKVYKNSEQNLYTIALLKKVDIKLEEELLSKIDTSSIEFEATHLKGLNEDTLTSLISKVIKGDKEHQEVLAQTIIKQLNNDKKKDEVNTLFAVETLNMLCDEKLYTTQKEKIKQLINTEIPLRFNKNIKDFSKALEETFGMLDKKHKKAFEHINWNQYNTEQKFNLMAYAVLEERLTILNIYFKDYGDAAVNTLLFSSWIGAMFDSNIVKTMLEAIANTDDELLQPLKEYIAKSSTCITLKKEHFMIIEEVYQILVRYLKINNFYRHSHHLLSIFLDKQLTYLVNCKLKNSAEAINQLYTFILDKLVNCSLEYEISSKHLLLYVHNVAQKALEHKRRFNNMETLYEWYLKIFSELYDDKEFKLLDYNLPIIIEHIEKEYLIVGSNKWQDNYLTILWKAVSLNDRLFNKDALTYINKMYPIINQLSTSQEDIKKRGDFYYKIGGYKYLHISYAKGLKELLLSVKYFKKIDKDKSELYLDSQATLSYAYGRIGELLQRSTNDISLKKKETRLTKALFYHTKSLEIIETLNQKFPTNMTYFIKTAVVYERIGQTHRSMNNVKEALVNLKKALTIKKEHYIATNKSFGYRKILIVISDFYRENDMEKESNEAILDAVKLTNETEMENYIKNHDQYQLESYIKIYKRYCIISKNNKYNEYLKQLLEVSKSRGLTMEY